MRVSVRVSDLVQTITPTIVDGFQNCSPSGVVMPFETFEQVCPRSRSYLKVKFCPDHNSYNFGWITL